MTLCKSLFLPRRPRWILCKFTKLTSDLQARFHPLNGTMKFTDQLSSPETNGTVLKQLPHPPVAGLGTGPGGPGAASPGCPCPLPSSGPVPAQADWLEQCPGCAAIGEPRRGGRSRLGTRPSPWVGRGAEPRAGGLTDGRTDGRTGGTGGEQDGADTGHSEESLLLLRR